MHHRRHARRRCTATSRTPTSDPDPLRLVDRGRAVGARRCPARVGVNAFGFGGINAPRRPRGGRPGHVGALPFAARRRGTPDDGDVAEAPAVRWGRPRRRRAERGRAPGPRTPPGCSWPRATTSRPVAAALDDDDAVLAGTDLTLGDRTGGRSASPSPTRRPKRLELARKVVDRGQPWRGRNDVWFAPDGLVARAAARSRSPSPASSRVRRPASTTSPQHFGVERRAGRRGRPTSSGRAPTSCTSAGCSPRRCADLRIRPTSSSATASASGRRCSWPGPYPRGDRPVRPRHRRRQPRAARPGVPGPRVRRRRRRGRDRGPARHRGVARQLPAPGDRLRVRGVGGDRPRSG